MSQPGARVRDAVLLAIGMTLSSVSFFLLLPVLPLYLIRVGGGNAVWSSVRRSWSMD
jgi:hypothetical protein